MSTDEELLGGLRHLQLSWNAPLSDPHADRLLAAMRLDEASSVLDLGCGWGELLLRSLSDQPRLAGVGVDRDPENLRRARENASKRGLVERARFVQADIREYTGTADRLICIAADHAWGDLRTALRSWGTSVTRGGSILFGCGFWVRAPPARLRAIFGPQPASFSELLSVAEEMGWDLRIADIADPAEWDDFESTWNRDLDDLANANPNGAVGEQARRLVDARRRDYLEGYRGVLGFAYLVLTVP